MTAPRLTGVALDQMLPMHLWLAPDGRMLSAGPTLRKLVPDIAADLYGQLVSARPGEGPCALAAVIRAVEERRRLFLRVVRQPDIVLRGHGARLDDESMLVNLGLGIDLHHAVGLAELTDSDFAPSDLAMELLFLHEANRAVLTELSRFNDQLAQSRQMALLQAQTDPLTGLQNRRGLEIALADALRNATPRPEATPVPFALIHLDLDHFKQVNDRLGHQAGDDLLRAVGGVLRSQIRKSDTAARIGGDEFVLIVRGLTLRKALEDLASRIIDAVRALSPPALTDISVSASMGIVICLPGHNLEAQDILMEADTALYRSKALGRGCATIA